MSKRHQHSATAYIRMVHHFPHSDRFSKIIAQESNSNLEEQIIV